MSSDEIQELKEENCKLRHELFLMSKRYQIAASVLHWIGESVERFELKAGAGPIPDDIDFTEPLSELC